MFLQLKMAEESKPGLRKPVFTKVEQLRPGTFGHTLTVKVVSVKMVLQKGRADGPQVRQMRIAECLVGDETGLIIFTARNDQGTFRFFFFWFRHFDWISKMGFNHYSVWLVGSKLLFFVLGFEEGRLPCD